MGLLQSPILLVGMISAVLSLILTLVNKVIVDQGRMKEIQKKVSSFNKELMRATKANDQAKVAEMNKEKPQVMQMQQEMMKMQMPMFMSMVPFIVVFIFLKKLAVSMDWGVIINLPFNIPLLGINNSFTWLGWYILASLPFTVLFRKILGVR
tara:strand:- start:58 stop:513 length:456 start_codon:yes stop_codon:yes gene_type:complete